MFLYRKHLESIPTDTFKLVFDRIVEENQNSYKGIELDKIYIVTEPLLSVAKTNLNLRIELFATKSKSSNSVESCIEVFYFTKLCE